MKVDGRLLDVSTDRRRAHVDVFVYQRKFRKESGSCSSCNVNYVNPIPTPIYEKQIFSLNLTLARSKLRGFYSHAHIVRLFHSLS